MKHYIGVKLIKAEPKLKGNIEGYQVIYTQPDGSEYTSWSPKDVFEEAYRLVNGMSFGLAIEALKLGHKVARTGWNGKDMFIVLIPAGYLPPSNSKKPRANVNDRTAKYVRTDTSLDSQPYLAMKTATEQWQPGWLASQADVLSDDWQIIN